MSGCEREAGYLKLNTYIHLGVRGKYTSIILEVLLLRFLAMVGSLGERLEFEILCENWFQILEIASTVGFDHRLGNP